MKVITEFIKFDDEDRGNIDYEGGEFPYGVHRDEKDHMFFLCYYTPNSTNGTVMSGKLKHTCKLITIRNFTLIIYL